MLALTPSSRAFIPEPVSSAGENGTVIFPLNCVIKALGTGKSSQRSLPAFSSVVTLKTRIIGRTR